MIKYLLQIIILISFSFGLYTNIPTRSNQSAVPISADINQLMDNIEWVQSNQVSNTFGYLLTNGSIPMGSNFNMNQKWINNPEGIRFPSSETFTIEDSISNLQIKLDGKVLELYYSGILRHEFRSNSLQLFDTSISGVADTNGNTSELVLASLLFSVSNSLQTGINSAGGLTPIRFMLDGVAYTNDDLFRVMSGVTGVITNVSAISTVQPTGADLLIDVSINGASIFSGTNTCVHITNSTGTNGGVLPSAASIITPQDIIEVSIPQVGSTIPGGNDLMIFIELE